MADHNPQHGRRQHFHRGRRGPERRGSERRTPQREQTPDANAREPRENGGVDVEQIMREIRARISQRHGIDLNNQQIQELAARRLEAILEPRTLKPQLLEQLRRSAGAAPDIPASTPLESYEFEDTTLYETHRGIVRFFRKLLNPILKLFFNPTPLIDAINTQARINKDLVARELERERRQSEWNALQYELVQRVVVETSRVSIEMQALAARIESLSAKVDFNDRKVRTLENPASAPPRPAPRQSGRTVDSGSERVEPAAIASTPQSDASPAEGATGEGTGEGKRRRRRRRGRRGGSGPGEPAFAANAAAAVEDDIDAGADADEDEPNDTAGSMPVAAEETPAAVSTPPEPVATTSVTPEPEREREPEPPAPVTPTPPRDEPTPDHPVDRADPGPVDR